MHIDSYYINHADYEYEVTFWISLQFKKIELIFLKNYHKNVRFP